MNKVSAKRQGDNRLLTKITMRMNKRREFKLRIQHAIQQKCIGHGITKISSSCIEHHHNTTIAQEHFFNQIQSSYSGTRGVIITRNQSNSYRQIDKILTDFDTGKVQKNFQVCIIPPGSDLQKYNFFTWLW